MTDQTVGTSCDCCEENDPPTVAFPCCTREDVTNGDLNERLDEIFVQINEIREFVNALREGIDQLSNSSNPMVRMMLGGLQV